MRNGLITLLLLVVVCSMAEARTCPPPNPSGSGGYVDDCNDVLRIECPAQGRILTGFRTRVGGQIGIITALHGVVGCSRISAFNLTESYADLKISLVDIQHDTAFLVATELIGAAEGLQTVTEFQGQELRVVGYPQALDYQFSHRVEPNLPPLRPLYTSLPESERLELERRGSPDIDQIVLSLSGAIQNGYSGAPILTWAGHAVGVANGGLRSGSVDIGWAMPIGQLLWQDARSQQSELMRLAQGQSSALFGAKASPSSTLPSLYLADGGNPVGRIYQLRNGHLSQIYQRPHGRLYSVTVAPSGKIYFSNANDYKIYRLDNGKEVVIFTHNTYTRDLSFGPGGHLYFSESSGAGGDGMIYRLQNGRATPYYKVQLHTIGGFWAGDFAFDGAGTLWLSNGNRRPAALYKVVKGTPRRVFSAATSITGFTFTTLGDLLYTDHKQGVNRLELPGYLASNAFHYPNFKWVTDVAVAKKRRTSTLLMKPLTNAVPPLPIKPIAKMLRQTAPSGDWIEVIAVRPTTGTSFAYGKPVTFEVKFRYLLKSADRARLVVSIGALPPSAKGCAGKGGSLVDAEETLIKRGTGQATVRVKWSGKAGGRARSAKGFLAFYPSLWLLHKHSRIAYFGQTPGFCYRFE